MISDGEVAPDVDFISDDTGVKGVLVALGLETIKRFNRPEPGDRHRRNDRSVKGLDTNGISLTTDSGIPLLNTPIDVRKRVLQFGGSQLTDRYRVKIRNFDSGTPHEYPFAPYEERRFSKETELRRTDASAKRASTAGIGV